MSNTELKILFEDKNVLVIDKPAGIATHPGLEKTPKPTIASLVAPLLSRSLLDSEDGREGIVHRLDKDTSGVMIIAKTLAAKVYLQAQFKKREVEKTYLALVEGVPKLKQAILDWPVGRNAKNPLKRAVRGNGKAAVTEYKVIERIGEKYSLLEARPKTGRTHQIRVHLAHLGHPVVGDRVYGSADPSLERQWLHAAKLSLKLPSGAQKTFQSTLPRELQSFLNRYNKT